MLILIVAGAWFWLDSLKAREIALAAGLRTCGGEGLQFLDWTVAQSRLRVRRNSEGQVRFERCYRFEYSETGNDRNVGTITLLGRRVLAVELGRQLIRGENVIPLQ
ncbi:MAG: DUF3301 domain-containing protein [Betaproteobacteria bacterium]